MNKKQIREDILKMIKGMENNTFMMPDSWSELIQMQKQDYSYKTYVGTRGNGRYINLEKYIGQEKHLCVLFRRDIVTIEENDIFKKVNIQEIYNFIKEVYEEKHSFQNHSEGERSIRKQISSEQSSIKKAQNNIKKLRQQLVDLKEIDSKDVILNYHANLLQTP